MKKTLPILMICLIVFSTVLMFASIVPVFAHSGVVLSAWASTPPTIDGTIDMAEWADADSVVYRTSKEVTGWFWVMNDDTNLYIALNTTDSTLSMDTTVSDWVCLYFDNDDNNPPWGTEEGDDLIGWWGYLSEGFRDGFCRDRADITWNRDSDWGGTSDGSAAATNDGTYNYFEISHPLDSIDDDHDFSLAPGDTVGFALYLRVDGIDRGWWPDPDWLPPPWRWHDIQISSGPIPTPTLSAWASRTPTINGIIRPGQTLTFLDPETRELVYVHFPGEWEDAAKVDFTLTTTGGGSHPATLYVMNDYINLYLALKVREEEEFYTHELFFNFDNDNDGVREAGDNQLAIRWSMLVGGVCSFRDLFFEADGSMIEDVSDGGTRDGVGVARFSDSTSSWIFEAVFPLNTTDDAHDFSLSVGSTVGFNLVYYDDDPSFGGYGGWPTFTFSDWSQMADIIIAGPPTPPPASNADLSITGIEVTQAIQFLNNSLPLVRRKTTAVRVYVDIGPVFDPIDVTVYLYGFSFPNQPKGVLHQSFSAPRNPDRGTTDHTANFLLPTSWVDISARLLLKGFVKADSAAQSEKNYTNNWMVVDGSPGLALSFNRTRTLNIHMVPINVTWATPQLPTSREISDQEEYFKAIFPVADVNVIPHGWRLVGAFSARAIDDLIAELNIAAGNLGISPPDQIFGVLSEDASNGMDHPGSSDPNWNIQGHSGLGVASAGGSAGSSREGVMTHEFIHNLGPGEERPTGVYRGWGLHTFDDADWPYPNNNINETGATAAWGWPPLIMPPTTPDIMSYSQSGTLPTKWISPYRWENLFNFLQIPSSTSSTSGHLMADASTYEMLDSLQISGWVSQNGTGSLAPIFRLPISPLQSEGEGVCSIELQDAAGKTLLAKSFEPSFEPIFVSVEGGERDLYHFAMFLPYQDGTARVVLKWNDTVIDAVQMSANPPTVMILAPNGGEVWNPGLQNVEWMANDNDGDPLTYRLYYSADNGATWTPISPSITQTSYQIDASFIQGGDTSLIRVVASDGFNTGQDESDAVFTVMDKPPTARILSPENESQFLMNDVILLRGRGTDADDVILPATAYGWTSDLDGHLGNGSTLTTMLTPGTHQITLTVTDSEDNSASDTVIITVTLDIEITGVIPSRTVVGQGLSVHIDVAVENRGPTTQTFSMTVYANTTFIDTLADITLTSGNSTTITFTWDTTGFAKGNYTISATATPVPGETDIADVTYVDGTVRVTIKGDINGDGIVDIKDIVIAAVAFGSHPGNPRWDPRADIATPYNLIDIFDLVTIAVNYGKRL